MNIHRPSSRSLIAALLIFTAAVLTAESAATLVNNMGKAIGASRFNPSFPYALTWKGAADFASLEPSSYAHVPTLDETRIQTRDNPRLQSVLLNNDIFALYGKPDARNMGIVGQYSLTEIESVMNEFVESYDKANGERGVIPAFYLIYGTCWPEGEIGILRDALIVSYIEFALERGWYVFLDHQIGKHSVETSVKQLLPWLKYPNVHLALDPEWRTTRPMQEIGSVTGAELNIAQNMIQEYIISHDLPGRRMLVVHQFKPRMILNRAEVQSDFERVKLIHCADGFGSPALKKRAYAANAEANNIPLKSFKLFLKPTIAGAGWDSPLMTPEEVLSLDPRPYLIMYQ